MDAVLPRLPSDVTIIRARRGAVGRSGKTQNRLYTVRWGNEMDALHRLKARNPYYSDVSLVPSRLADIAEGRGSLALKNWARRRNVCQKTWAHPPTR